MTLSSPRGMLEEKFEVLTRDVLPEETRKKMLQILWNLENYDASDVLDTLAL